MVKLILIKLLIIEKVENFLEGLNKYSFVVDCKVNKVEICKVVEDMYGVVVIFVNIVVMFGKLKNRMIKLGIFCGCIFVYKKVVVILVDGEEIDFFGDI